MGYFKESWHLGGWVCLRADVGIYTRIINYIPWIENTIRNNWVLMAGILDLVTPPVPKSSLITKSNQVSWVVSHTPVHRPAPQGGWLCLPVCDYTWQLSSSSPIDDDGKLHTSWNLWSGDCVLANELIIALLNNEKKKVTRLPSWMTKHLLLVLDSITWALGQAYMPMEVWEGSN